MDKIKKAGQLAERLSHACTRLHNADAAYKEALAECKAVSALIAGLDKTTDRGA